MSSLEEYDQSVALAITTDPEEQDNLVRAFETARAPFNAYLSVLQESYAYTCFWLPVVQRERMKASGEKVEWQFRERYVEAAIESLRTALISTMHLNKQERGSM